MRLKNTQINWDELYEFFNFIDEREAIRQRRRIKPLPEPLTDDPILQTYFFCNVRRRHDRTTRWIIKNVIRKEDDPKDLIWKVIWARIFNRMPEDLRNPE